MIRFPTVTLALILLAGCSASDPKPMRSDFASVPGTATPASTSDGFALPPPAAPQSASAAPVRSLADLSAPPGDAAAFPAAPAPASAIGNCRTIGAVTTCDAASNPDAADTHYTN